MEEEQREQTEIMNCGVSDKSEEELKADGWIEAWSFHRQNPEQWSEACQKVNSYNNLEGYKVTLVNPADKSQVRDGVQVIYFKRPEN